MKPFISLICSTYNKPDFLEKKIISLVDQSQSDFELVIADDGSGPATEQVIQQYKTALRYPIKHIRHDDIGFRKAVICNQAVLAAQADYLFFTDDDCVFHRRTIERHALHSATGRIVCGRRVDITSDGNHLCTLDVIKNRSIETMLFLKKTAQKQTLKYASYRPWQTFINQRKPARILVLGCNMSMYRSDFLSVNGFDERIDFPGEDTNLFYRCIKRNMTLRYLPNEAIMYHLDHSKKYPDGAKDKAVVKEILNPPFSWTNHGVFKTTR